MWFIIVKLKTWDNSLSCARFLLWENNTFIILCLVNAFFTTEHLKVVVLFSHMVFGWAGEQQEEFLYRLNL